MTTRRLAAIVAADVAGYTRLMGNDGEGTLAALKAHRRAQIRTALDDVPVGFTRSGFLSRMTWGRQEDVDRFVEGLAMAGLPE